MGGAVARLAAERGYAVAVNYARDREQAERVVADIEVLGGTAISVAADVSLEGDVIAMFERVTKELGPVTGLVNNAGILGGPALVADVTVETLERTFAINVVGSFLCAREAVRRMAHSRGGQGGAIVNVSSRAAEIGSGGEFVHYAASKGAIETFTRGLAIELASDGVRVNAVSPGLIDTEIHARGGVGGRLERLTPYIPMKRAGTAGEVAEAVLWLLSDAASYVTGASLNVGGGR